MDQNSFYGGVVGAPQVSPQSSNKRKYMLYALGAMLALALVLGITSAAGQSKADKFMKLTFSNKNADKSYSLMSLTLQGVYPPEKWASTVKDIQDNYDSYTLESKTTKEDESGVKLTHYTYTLKLKDGNTKDTAWANLTTAATKEDKQELRVFRVKRQVNK